MFQLLWQGLQTIQQDTPIHEHYGSYPTPFQQLFTAQQKIGWDQLYYGRISTQWAQHVTSNSNYKINGDVFYSQTIGILWDYFFDCWMQRNNHLHSPTVAPLDYPILAEQVRQIIEAAATNPVLANVAPNQTAEQILQRPLPLIRSWAQRGAQHMQNYLTAAHKCTVLHTQDIRNFFQPKKNPDLRPP